jgi:hypothetical protein
MDEYIRAWTIDEYLSCIVCSDSFLRQGKAHCYISHTIKGPITIVLLDPIVEVYETPMLDAGSKYKITDFCNRFRKDLCDAFQFGSSAKIMPSFTVAQRPYQSSEQTNSPDQSSFFSSLTKNVKENFNLKDFVITVAESVQPFTPTPSGVLELVINFSVGVLQYFYDISELETEIEKLPGFDNQTSFDYHNSQFFNKNTGNW